MNNIIVFRDRCANCRYINALPIQVYKAISFRITSCYMMSFFAYILPYPHVHACMGIWLTYIYKQKKRRFPLYN